MKRLKLELYRDITGSPHPLFTEGVKLTENAVMTISGDIFIKNSDSDSPLVYRSRSRVLYSQYHGTLGSLMGLSLPEMQPSAIIKIAESCHAKMHFKRKLISISQKWQKSS